MQKLDYQFFTQAKIVSGDCSLENIPAELESYNARKPLVIADKDVTKRGLHKKFIKAFYDSGMPIGGIFDEVRNYANIGLARDAVILYKERGCDSFIALGAGKAADVARAANIIISENTDNLLPFFEGMPLSGPLRPFIMVPTCCQRGTESGNKASIDNREIKSDFLYPDVIVIDKRITQFCSSECAAQTAAIILDNAVTALMDKDLNPMNDAFIYSALQFVSENMKKSIRSPRNKKASLAMANAAIMGGIAKANAGPGMVGLFAEELAKETGHSSTLLTAVLLPWGLMYAKNSKKQMSDGLLLGLAGMDTYSATREDLRSDAGIDAALSLLKSMKKAIPASLESLKIPEYKFQNAAEKAAARSEKNFTREGCLAMLELARQGQSK